MNKEMKLSETPIYAQRMRTLRIENGISQDRLSMEMGVSQNAVYRYETGLTDPSRSVLSFYAKRFQVSVDWILGMTEVREGNVDYARREVERVKSNQEEEFSRWINAIADEGNEAIARLMDAISLRLMEGMDQNLRKEYEEKYIATYHEGLKKDKEALVKDAMEAHRQSVRIEEEKEDRKKQSLGQKFMTWWKGED